MSYWIRLTEEALLEIVTSSGRQTSSFESGATFKQGITTVVPYIHPPTHNGGAAAEISTNEGQSWTPHTWLPAEWIKMQSGGGG